MAGEERFLTHLLVLGERLLGLGELVALSLLGHGIFVVRGHCDRLVAGLDGGKTEIKRIVLEEKKEGVRRKRSRWMDGDAAV